MREGDSVLPFSEGPARRMIRGQLGQDSGDLEIRLGVPAAQVDWLGDLMAVTLAHEQEASIRTLSLP